MTPWEYVKDEKDFARYRDRFASEHNTLQESLTWGDTPVEYPCLVTSVLLRKVSYVGATNTSRVLSAYVYAADVDKFLKPKAKTGKKSEPKPPTQDQFNRWSAALLSTVVHFMVRTGICKQGQFEEQLLQEIERVDAVRNGTQIKASDDEITEKVTTLNNLFGKAKEPKKRF